MSRPSASYLDSRSDAERARDALRPPPTVTTDAPDGGPWYYDIGAEPMHSMRDLVDRAWDGAPPMTVETEYPALLDAVRHQHPRLVNAIETNIALLAPTAVTWQPHEDCALGRWTARVGCTPDEAARLTGVLQQTVGSPPADLRVVTVS